MEQPDIPHAPEIVISTTPMGHFVLWMFYDRVFASLITLPNFFFVGCDEFCICDDRIL